MRFSAWLKTVRFEKGLTVRDIERMSGYNAESIWKWEREASYPNFNAFNDVIEALGYELHIIPKGSNEREQGFHEGYAAANEIIAPTIKELTEWLERQKRMEVFVEVLEKIDEDSETLAKWLKDQIKAYRE